MAVSRGHHSGATERPPAGHHRTGETLEGRTPSPRPSTELTGTHLGPCFYLGSPVQQEPHHDHVPPAGGDMQWRDAVLEGGGTGTSQAVTSSSPEQWLCTPCLCPPSLMVAAMQEGTFSLLVGCFSPRNDLKTYKDMMASLLIPAIGPSPVITTDWKKALPSSLPRERTNGN